MHMVGITKEKIEKAQSEEVPNWREKKTKRTLLKEYIKSHKLLTTAVVGVGICIFVNVILIYSFFRILGTL